ncbi:MAG: TIGR00303 family protein [Thermosynechococcus sp. Uc]|uniref:nicotinate mononucleotide-dependent phosphoribosyltransferase CobT n=1 Tax=Thermosynechococcus sp. Uc TaxID=3034853 RepID=UPI00259F76FA|nr:TIGR00303 family protein [Thermosynechococcus sp. Uc]MDM7327565.1 TIGR00303 family protein [Thermosynechococcus sp. Uc]
MIGIGAGESIARAWSDRHCQHQDPPALVCVLGFTETALIPGISAAGQTPSDRRITALADGEFLLRGIQPHYHYPLPPLTAGASPSLISRALIEALELPLYVFDAGLPLPRLPEMIHLGGTPARCLTTGQAMTTQTVAHLWEQGWSWGAQLSSEYPWLILAECVVGGTTTALALCESLGIVARDCVGSSHRQSNHEQKWQLVQRGLAHLPAEADPFTCVAAIGDPMQVVVAAMALRASQTCGVLLAGGSQMIAVYALARSVAHWRRLPWCLNQIVVGTTRWLVEDPTAQIQRLAERAQCPLLYTQLDFSLSRHPALRAYEQGFVKEGVGAGGCAIAAHLLAGWSNSEMVNIIDRLGDRYHASGGSLIAN